MTGAHAPQPAPCAAPAGAGLALLRPQWRAPGRVQAFVTLRAGGCSQGPWGHAAGGGMNLGAGEEDAQDVARNRALLARLLPQAPVWLRQVHGARVADAATAAEGDEADAVFSTRPGLVCCVRVADCLPVLLADAQGRGVAAVHAGWRGLAAGVIGNAVGALRGALGDAHAPLLAFLGPAIGPAHFIVGPEVRTAMRALLPDADDAFVDDAPGKFRADLFALARQALALAGVGEVVGGGQCTVADPLRFYSFRRDGRTGRHAAAIWIAHPAEPLPL